MLLPKIARARINVAVIAKTPEQRTAIEKLNKVARLSENEKILCAQSVAGALSVMSREQRNVGHSYYLKDESEEDPYLNAVTTISVIAERIIEALNAIVNVSSKLLREYDEARRVFEQAV